MKYEFPFSLKKEASKQDIWGVGGWVGIWLSWYSAYLPCMHKALGTVYP